MCAFDLAGLEGRQRCERLREALQRERGPCFARYLAAYAPAGAGGCAARYREHLASCLEHTAGGGKGLRGALCAGAFLAALEAACPAALADPAELPRVWETALDLGFAMEIAQASFTVFDDVLDHAAERRGAPAWRKVVGDQAALLDALALLSLADTLVADLDRRCGATLRLVACYQEAKRRTVYGEYLDTAAARPAAQGPALAVGPDGVAVGAPAAAQVGPAPEEADAAAVAEIHANKTAYYSFVLPAVLGYRAGMLCGRAALLAAATGSSDAFHPTPSLPQLPELSADAEARLQALGLEMGLLYQMQDDYLDAFAPAALRKRASDVRERKPTWVLAKAMELAHAAVAGRPSELAPDAAADVLSRLRLEYGRAAPDEAEVLACFARLGVPAAFAAEAQRRWGSCCRLAQDLPVGLRVAFQAALDLLHSRCGPAPE